MLFHLKPLLKVRYHEREIFWLLAAFSAVLSFTTLVGCFAKSFTPKFFSFKKESCACCLLVCNVKPCLGYMSALADVVASVAP